MQERTDDLPDPDGAATTMLVEDRRHRVPDLWEAVRSGLDGGALTFPTLREEDPYATRRPVRQTSRFSDSP